MSHSEAHRFNAIVVDSDLDARIRLRQATTAVQLFGEVLQVSNLNEGLYAVQRLGQCDVVFFSEIFPSDEVQRFIAQAKQEKMSQDAAFIQILKKHRDDSQYFAKEMMSGIDGFLFEPYSVNQLVEITELASKVKKERSETRSKVAITMILGDAMAQLDLVSMLKAMGLEVGRAMKRLREIGESLKGIASGCVEIYHSLATKLFGEARPPSEMEKMRQYRGVSMRVKKRMGEKLVEALENKQKSGQQARIVDKK